ncbi:hypothetical protein [Saccharopolyspora hordei]|uniref:Excreted virulence factor EspC (Type VII ESX diderm) n=1 Tax=Saccharopolyspora hordei TaxID=1838 RepID=A0A853AV65_9PSEU|nr:hypothetical protein [Saccharopolyspora hordei]NYI86537.1 hypothetical protein [Saccharopolyspora hordei]
MTFTADPDVLRKAGKSATRAGERAGQVTLGPPVEDVAGAMPGGRSEGAAKQVAQSWQQAVAQWSAAAAEHGRSLTASADEYQGSDEAGAQGIRAAGGR